MDDELKVLDLAGYESGRRHQPTLPEIDEDLSVATDGRSRLAGSITKRSSAKVTRLSACHSRRGRGISFWH